MTVTETSPGQWAVVQGDKIIRNGFTSNAAAWRWIDHNTDSGRADTDQHNRIRDAFAER